MKRQSGFYWCLRGYLWDVAYYSQEEELWWVNFDEMKYTDDDMDKIHPERLTPPEV